MPHVCGTAMVAEKREPDDTIYRCFQTTHSGWVRHCCFNCGAVVEVGDAGGGAEPDDDGDGA